MPKQKTKKSIAKRFKITKSGKVLRFRQFSRHKRSKKKKSKIREFKVPVKVTKKQAKMVKSRIVD